MPVIDVCFFVPRFERQQAERLLGPFIGERVEVDRYQEGYDHLTRYVVRLWSAKIAQELFAELAEASINPSSDIYFSLLYDPVAEADVSDLIEEFLPAEVVMVKKKIYDAFLGPEFWDKTKVLSYDIFLASPEEEKRAVAEDFAEKLRISGIIPAGRHWYVYISKYL